MGVPTTHRRRKENEREKVSEEERIESMMFLKGKTALLLEEDLLLEVRVHRFHLASHLRLNQFCLSSVCMKGVQGWCQFCSTQVVPNRRNISKFCE
jgi:hypothetical protein